MDARRFDRLARALTEAGTRRGLLGLLATLPVLGGLLALLEQDELDAKGRRKRRKKPHHHRKKTGNRSGNTKKRRCKPESKGKTCAGGKCGPIKNNCKKTVDCGSCDCPAPCDPCFFCQTGPNTPGQCAVDPDQHSEPCGGSEGQVCHADGSCVCNASTCPACAACQEDGVCGTPCDGEGCCAGDACASGESDTACGRDGQTCDVCDGTETCTNHTCVPRPCGAGGVCRVFVTSTTHQGNFGGLTPADGICQGRATAAGLPGTYKAWLSDDTGSPSTRFVQSTGPYRLVDGTTIATSWADLTDGGLQAPIVRSETGQNILDTGETFAWTGTAPNGTLGEPTSHCNRWSSSSFSVLGIPGWAASASTTWTQSGNGGCDLPERLYCFQQS